MEDKKILIIGSGISGITLAERFAAKGNQVILIDRRDHIGGNCYDFYDENGILIHKYGPHIFHTDNKEVWDYLSQFTKWREYQHKVLGFVDGKFIPIPFNINSLHMVFSAPKAEKLEKKIISTFGLGSKVPILELKRNNDNDLKNLADYIYEKVFLHYTEKQWGLKPEQIDPAVSGRVPVFISRDDRYFQDKYQGMPLNGYSEMFKKMLCSGNIEIILNTEFNKIKNNIGNFKKVFYTGQIDEFFGYKYGNLEYRSIKMKFNTYSQESYQPAAVVNYPNDHDYTRTTEFKKLTGQINKKTVIGFEYPGNEGFSAYPILNKKNKEIFQKYKKDADALKTKNIYFLGRLAEYKYYDMDDAVANALNIAKSY